MYLIIILGVFDHFKKIETLQMAHNNIKNMTSFISPGLESLRDLDLSDNKIEVIIPEGAFTSMKSLRVLNLEENFMQQV